MVEAKIIVVPKEKNSQLKQIKKRQTIKTLKIFTIKIIVNSQNFALYNFEIISQKKGKKFENEQTEYLTKPFRYKFVQKWN